MTPEERLTQIAQTVSTCTACTLHKGRTVAVPGVGPANADLFFIGEAPGYYDDKRGQPFLGPSGKYLEELLAIIEIKRDEVFLTNVVRCHPPQNREPLSTEIEACKTYLTQQLEVVQPKIIVTLGRFSTALYFPSDKLTQIRGKPKQQGQKLILPVLHPAAALRNSSLRSVMEQDFYLLKQLLEGFESILEAEPTPVESTPEPPKQLSLFD